MRSGPLSDKRPLERTILHNGERRSPSRPSAVAMSRQTASTICWPVAILISGCLFGCGSKSVPMYKALETDHFIVLRQVGLPQACDSLGEWLEGYYTVFGQYLEVQRSESRKITYEQFSDSSAAETACDGAGLNCYFADSDTIVSVVPLYAHEIAHVFETLVGGPASGPAFFSEGVASVLGGGFSFDTPDRRVDPSVPLENLLDDTTFRAYEQGNDGGGVLYSSTAGFVRYLIDDFGKEPFLRFFGSLDGVTQGSAIESAFAAMFGQSLADTIQAWRAGTQPIVDDLLVVSAGCQISPELPGSGSLGVDPECFQRGFRFEVPGSGRQDLLLDGTAGGFVQLRSCDRGDLIPGSGLTFWSGTSEFHIAVDAPPGSYEGIVSSAPATVSIPATPVTVDLDASCSSPRTPAEIGGPQSTYFGRSAGGAAPKRTSHSTSACSRPAPSTSSRFGRRRHGPRQHSPSNLLLMSERLRGSS